MLTKFAVPSTAQIRTHQMPVLEECNSCTFGFARPINSSSYLSVNIDIGFT